jgi:cytoskeletal protein CcmA (bactofilin family)
VEKTVIGSSFVIEGDLECAEALEVHGRVRGKSVSARSVTVLASGSVEAEVKGETVRVEGAVVGTINRARRPHGGRHPFAADRDCRRSALPR